MQNFCLEDKLVLVLNFIVMHSKGIKTTTRCAVDVALRGGSEMGTLMIELSKTPFTVMTYLIFQETKIYLLGEYIPIKFKNIGTCL